MAVEINGATYETTENGYLVNIEEWSRDVAGGLAASESIELTEKHWDVIDYLREEYFNNNGNQPNNRTIIKEMSDKWGHKVSNKEIFDLFPGNPSKQAGLIAGLPESRRKGGY
jgi:tRNA 2-thiouridine synthesizing protein E